MNGSPANDLYYGCLLFSTDFPDRPPYLESQAAVAYLHLPLNSRFTENLFIRQRTIFATIVIISAPALLASVVG